MVDAGNSTEYTGTNYHARKLLMRTQFLSVGYEVDQCTRCHSATSNQVLQGITRSHCKPRVSSRCIVPETTKVLNEAAIYGKADTLEGLKENVLWSFNSGRNGYERIRQSDCLLKEEQELLAKAKRDCCIRQH